eukprot:752102-Hanusia_phi.AAC.1
MASEVRGSNNTWGSQSISPTGLHTRSEAVGHQLEGSSSKHVTSDENLHGTATAAIPRIALSPLSFHSLPLFPRHNLWPIVCPSPPLDFLPRHVSGENISCKGTVDHPPLLGLQASVASSRLLPCPPKFRHAWSPLRLKL